MFGFLNLHKPTGITSFQATHKIGRLVRPARVGHAGTLDPLASGVLVVAVGLATRLIQYVQQLPKRYVARFRFGYESDTQDITGDLRTVDCAPISPAALELALDNFRGWIQQTPPKFSALKVNGQRAYELARKQKDFELSPRRVLIDQLRLTEYHFPDWQIEIECSKGTYVRTLGVDIARHLGCAAVMTALTRTAVGPFRIDDAWHPFDDGDTDFASHLIEPRFIFRDWPEIVASTDQIENLKHGRAIDWDREREQAIVIDSHGRLLAVLSRDEQGKLQSTIHFAHIVPD